MRPLLRKHERLRTIHLGRQAMLLDLRREDLDTQIRYASTRRDHVPHVGRIGRSGDEDIGCRHIGRRAEQYVH
jgi:hypothetical protein